MYRVPFAPINNIAQTFAHPQAVARGIAVEVEVKQLFNTQFQLTDSNSILEQGK
jgi:crotonobetainyl-CoA:carnitine CoA-transferase CaiB-like acyl-CoA transferase